MSEKELALKIAVAESADEALTRAGAGRGSGRGAKAAVRYANAMKQLEARLSARLPQDLAQLDRKIELCAARGVARALAPAEILQVRSFMATALGQRFWDASGLSLWPLRNCYSAVLDLGVTDEDYRAVGVRSRDR